MGIPGSVIARGISAQRGVSDLGGRLLQGRTAWLFAATRFEIAVLRHHDLALEDADQRAVLLVSLGLDMDNTPVVLGRRLPLVENRGLAIDGVPVEGRRHVTQRLDLEIGNGLADTS